MRRFSLDLVWDHGPPNSSRRAQQTGTLGLTLASRQQPFQPYDGILAQLHRPASPLAPLPKLGLAAGLGFRKRVLAVSVMVIGLFSVRRSGITIRRLINGPDI